MFGDLILAHLVGDYLLQNDFIAQNKKSNKSVCVLHVVLYILPFIAILSTYGSLTSSLYSLTCSLLFFLLVATQHFLQDYYFWTHKFMAISKQSQFAKPPFAPWSIIVVDNTLHLAFIWFAYINLFYIPKSLNLF